MKRKGDPLTGDSSMAKRSKPTLVDIASEKHGSQSRPQAKKYKSRKPRKMKAKNSDQSFSIQGVEAMTHLVDVPIENISVNSCLVLSKGMVAAQNQPQDKC